MTSSELESRLQKQLADTLFISPNIDLISLNEIAIKQNEINALSNTDVPEKRAIDIATEVAEAHKASLQLGVTVKNKKTFEPWLAERKSAVEMKRSAAYDSLLIGRNWGAGVVRALGRQTDQIIELMGDPKVESGWHRRGLVIGEVQSGKTSTYTGVLNKALDLGYQIVVVIGGHTEDLRRQTQERLDSDLIGEDTSYRTDPGSPLGDMRIGVGQINSDIGTNSLTSVRYDFSQKTAESTAINLTTGNPTVFVIKKNSGVLNNLTEYIRLKAPGGIHDVPLAVIDDESDWASVNTSARNKERTAVNRAILALLNSSRRSSYLGITATPFANILIDDDKDTQDLFPGDYIVALESPSSYRGVDYYFPPEGENSENIITDIGDFHALLPQKHRKDSVVTQLAPSLEEAIFAFYLATAARYRREGRQVPASMMVNVSRFNDVQEKISNLIEHFIETVNEGIFASVGFLTGRTEQSSKLIERLQKVADKRYSAQQLKVPDLGEELLQVAEDVGVELVNGLTMKSRNQALATLTRKQLASVLKRPKIFVGGNVLARGLTLDGLVTTYFTRRAGAADTLLQMGRWFGHRPRYEDLTRVWMDANVVEHFSYVAGVSQDLRSSVAEMRDFNMTPREFGLKIRLHPEASFLITAANKQRSGVVSETPGVFSYRGRAFETHTIRADQDSNRNNRESVVKLLRSLESLDRSICNRDFHGRNVFWRNVPHEVMESFLQGFNMNPELPTSKVFGKGNDEVLPASIVDLGRQGGWTIGVMSGSGQSPIAYLADTGMVAVSDVRASYRNIVELSSDSRDIELSQRRLATGGNIVASSTEEERSAALEGRRAAEDLQIREGNDPGLGPDRKLTQAEVLRYGPTGPMLLIYTVSLDPKVTVAGDPTGASEIIEGQRRLRDLGEVPALVMAIPGLTEAEAHDDSLSNGVKYGISYVMNPVLARRVAGIGHWDDDDEDEE